MAHIELLDNSLENKENVLANAIEPIKFVRSCVAVLMLREPSLTEIQALDKIAQLAIDSHNPSQPGHPEYLFWDALVKADIKPEVFEEMKALAPAPLTTQYLSLGKALKPLKGSDPEIFSVLTEQSDKYLAHLLYVADPMQNFLKVVSEWMTDGRYTLEEAVSRSLAEKYVLNLYLLEEKDVRVMLFSAAKIDLYIHATLGIYMGKDNYDGRHPENAYLYPNALFHLAHPEKIYLQVKDALVALTFSLKEINKVLADNTKGTIELLKKQIELMPTLIKRIKALMSGPEKLSYSHAQRAVLNSAYNNPECRLSEGNFRQLLSINMRKELGYTSPGLPYLPNWENVQPYRPIYIIPQRVLGIQPPPQDYLPTPAVDNSDALRLLGATAGVAVMFLLLLAICNFQPGLRRSVASLVRNTGGRVLGCFQRPETKSEESLEMIVTDENDTSKVLGKP